MNRPDWSARRDAGAIQFMLLDIIANLLTFTDNPKEMGAYFTRQIREIVGAKKVILVQAPVTQKGVHRIVSVEPKREWDAIPSSELDCLARCCRANEGSALWIRGEACQEVNEALARMGVGCVIATPLKVGKEWAGALFVVDLIEFSRTADNTDVLDVLSPVVALVLRNAGFFEAQEEVIEERTKALSQSERSFHSLAKVAPVGIFRLDAEGNFLFANDRMREITGATGSIPDTEHWTQILQPEDRPGVEAGLGRTLSTGENFRQEFRLLTPSGEWATVIGEAVSECDENGVITGFIGTLTDITQRKLMEEALRDSHQFNLQVIQSAQEGVVVFGPDLHYRVWNAFMEKISGLSANEVLGRHPLTLFPFLEAVGLPDRWGKALTGEEVGSIDFQIQHPISGKPVWLTDTSAPLRDTKGEIIGVITVVRDITESKLAEEALRESEKNYRRLVHDMPVGVLLQGPQTEIRLSNAEALELLGLSEDQLLGKTSFDPDWNVIHEDGSPFPGPTHPVAQAIANRHSIRKIVMGVYRPRKGDRVWLSVDAEPQLNDDGTVQQVVCTFMDITQRKQAEEERRQLEERMSRIQKLEALGVLVAGVAHNINNVLAAIMGMASVREWQTAEAKDLEAYAIIGTACKRGRDVVKSLMQFAQPTLSNRGPLEVHALIAEVRVLLEATTRNRIEILETFTGEPVWVNGDAGSLSHALMNLCLNALDAMPGGGTLTFRTALPEPDWVEIAVEDNGEGMPPEILARVTEPFFTTKDVGKGTGLGLSMTHGVITAHGGILDIASTPGQGTTVKLRIPRIPPPAHDPSIAAPAPILRPLHVLLVDDDEDVRYLVSRMLKMAGLQVKSAASGEEALESLGSGALPDLIILDQNMPRMSGIQTMEKIRVLHPDVLILISSGQPDIEDWPCFKQPNVAVISKPFELEELMAKLAHLSPNP